MPVTAAQAADAVVYAASLVPDAGGSHVHLANAFTLALADSHPEVRRVFAGSALNLADGKPLAWFSLLRRQSPRVHHVRGPQLFLDVFARDRAAGLRHFLLGSTPETLAALSAALESRFPGVAIVGAESPPFRELTPDELAEQDARITASGAQIVWIGLGTPKQDFEAKRLGESLPVVAVAIGAAFDFTAGTTREAPKWLRTLGLEWLFRLASEPRRLWRRYLFGNLRFILSVIRNWGAS